MTPEKPTAMPRYAMLLNGSHLACAVLHNLLRKGYAPGLLVVPEYPPADVGKQARLPVEKPAEPRRLAAAIEQVYAPREWQGALARRLRRDDYDFLLVACWPYLLEQTVVTSVTRCALNLHPSMLPAYRGADPIGAQLECAEPTPGVTLHLLSSRFDHGDIVVQAQLPRTNGLNSRPALETACAKLGAQLFTSILEQPERAHITTPQEHSLGPI